MTVGRGDELHACGERDFLSLQPLIPGDHYDLRAYIDDFSAERLASLQEQNLELTRLVTELRNEAALRTQFLSNISHDLRTPLTAIITHGEILRDGILGELTTRQKDSVTGIIGGGRQLLDMIGEILTYARGDANQRAPGG